MGEDRTCCKCGFFRGHPNTTDKNGWVTKFICRDCKSEIDNSDKISEIEFGA